MYLFCLGRLIFLSFTNNLILSVIEYLPYSRICTGIYERIILSNNMQIR